MGREYTTPSLVAAACCINAITVARCSRPSFKVRAYLYRVDNLFITNLARARAVDDG